MLKMKLAILLLVTICVLGSESSRLPKSLDMNEDLDRIEENQKNIDTPQKRHKRQFSRRRYHWDRDYENPRYYDRFNDDFDEIEMLKRRIAILEESQRLLEAKLEGIPKVVYVPTPYFIPVPWDARRPVNDSSDVGDRYGNDDDDPARIWGTYYPPGVSNRPSKPQKPVQEPPTVEQGTVESEVRPTTKPPYNVPTECQAASLFCCKEKGISRRNCFERLDCLRTYQTQKACLPEVLKYTIQQFINAYKPDDE